MVPSSEFGFRKGKREQWSEHWEESSDEQLRAELFNTFGLPPKTDPVIMLVRYVDAIIIPDGESKIAKAGEVSLEGKDIICIQAKHGRLGMYLMGQAFFSERLLQKFKPRTIVSVALCTEDDSTLRPLLESYPSMKVVIIKA